MWRISDIVSTLCDVKRSAVPCSSQQRDREDSNGSAELAIGLYGARIVADDSR